MAENQIILEGDFTVTTTHTVVRGVESEAPSLSANVQGARTISGSVAKNRLSGAVSSTKKIQANVTMQKDIGHE